MISDEKYYGDFLYNHNASAIPTPYLNLCCAITKTLIECSTESLHDVSLVIKGLQAK